MSSAERWHYKFTAAQFRITTPEGQRPTPKELGNATQAAKSFDVVLQGGVHGNYIYTHKKDGQKYFATNAVSAYQSLRDKFKWINYPKAHAKTRERVAARYVILANDPRPKVADAAQEMLNLLRRQKKGVVNTAALRQASQRLCEALKPHSPSGGSVIVPLSEDESLSEDGSLSPAINASQPASGVDPVNSKSDRPPLPHVPIGTVNERAQTIASSDALSTLRNYVAALPIGSVLMQYRDGDDGRVAYAGARRPDDPVPAEERALNTAFEQDFADTLKFLAESHMDHDTKFADAYFIIKLVNKHLQAGTPITVTHALRTYLGALCEDQPQALN